MTNDAIRKQKKTKIISVSHYWISRKKEVCSKLMSKVNRIYG